MGLSGVRSGASISTLIGLQITEHYPIVGVLRILYDKFTSTVSNTSCALTCSNFSSLYRIYNESNTISDAFLGHRYIQMMSWADWYDTSQVNTFNKLTHDRELRYYQPIVMGLVSIVASRTRHLKTPECSLNVFISKKIRFCNKDKNSVKLDRNGHTITFKYNLI